MKREIWMANQVSSTAEEGAAFRTELQASVRAVVENCRAARKRKRGRRAADRHERRAALRGRALHRPPAAGQLRERAALEPRLVNIVSLAEAVPVPGSGVKLPLDLRAIAALLERVLRAKRFAAVQLAFSNYRCRVLVFHTGRFVGTGCSPDGCAVGHPQGGATAGRRGGRARRAAQVCGHQPGGRGLDRREARLRRVRLDALGHVALRSCELRRCAAGRPACRPLCVDCVPLRAGLAWRPGGEPICCEIYGTGRQPAGLRGSATSSGLLAHGERAAAAQQQAGGARAAQGAPAAVSPAAAGAARRRAGAGGVPIGVPIGAPRAQPAAPGRCTTSSARRTAG